MFFLAATNDPSAGVGVIAAVMAVAMITVTVIWVLFPFMTHYHFGQLRRLQEAVLKAQREGNSLLHYIAQRLHEAEVSDRKSESSTPKPPAIPKTEPEVYKLD